MSQTEGIFVLVLRWKMFGFIPRKTTFKAEDIKTWAEAYHAADMLREFGEVSVFKV